MRKLGDGTSKGSEERHGQGDAAGERARGVVRRVEKPLQKLIQKIVRSKGAGEATEKGLGTG